MLFGDHPYLSPKAHRTVPYRFACQLRGQPDCHDL